MARFQLDFPNFSPENCSSKEISPFDPKYNCIAWAAGDRRRWWWPDDPDFGYGYWPSGVKREETLVAFVAAFGTLGYEECPEGTPERGFDKIALFIAADGTPTHAARQLSDGTWSSKLGVFEDVCHADLDCLTGPLYGRVAAFLRRKSF